MRRFGFTFSKKKLLPTLLIVGLFVAFLYFPLFMQLGSLALEPWDEALFALRALYMYDTNEYMINFNQFEGGPDHMNTKLPFTTFFQVLGLYAFGVSELGVRAPIAIIFLLTTFYLVYFFKKTTDSFFIGIGFGALLVSSSGFMGFHMMRTADQDVAFACYVLLSALFFYLFFITKKTKHLLFFTLFFLAGLLTKNLLVLLVVPGLFFFVLIKKELLSFLKDVRVYLCILVIIGVYISTIAYFEWQHPGFFDRMWNYELFGRYTQTIENHGGSFFHYLDLFFTDKFYPFSYLMILSLFFIFNKKTPSNHRALLLLLFCLFLFYLLGVSYSKTKTSWYIAPLYPLAALIISLGLYHFYNSYLKKRLIGRLFFIVLCFAFIFPNYYSSVDTLYKKPPKAQEQILGKYLKSLRKQGYLKEHTVLLDEGFGPSTIFTTEVYNRKYAFNLSRAADLNNLSGKTVLMCSKTLLSELEKNYTIRVLNEKEKCKLVKVY